MVEPMNARELMDLIRQYGQECGYAEHCSDGCTTEYELYRRIEEQVQMIAPKPSFGWNPYA